MPDIYTTQNPDFSGKSVSLFLYDKSKPELLKARMAGFDLDLHDSLVSTLTENEDFLLTPLAGKDDYITVCFYPVNNKKPNYIRDTFSKTAAYFYGKHFDKIYIDIEAGIPDPEVKHFTEAAEGFYLGLYRFDKYKSDKKENPGQEIYFVTGFDLKNNLNEIKDIFRGVNFARDLSNEPANFLTPEKFGELAKLNLESDNTTVEYLGYEELKKNNFNLILQVGGASSNPPGMIKIHYKPAVTPKKHIALVGKGVTYDAGGLSIKTTPGMFEMKADMAGGATVAGLLLAASLNNVPYEITGFIPVVENMISGISYKPGDVLKAYNGKTVEIGDTDAEGRLILADALSYAQEFNPDYIIDLATLTGAAYVALGPLFAAGFANNDNLAESMVKAGEEVYERVWRMPLVEEYKSMLDTTMADIKNLGPRQGGAITAAEFLHFFVDDKYPWMHLDIAGPAIKHDSLHYTKNYNTGFGVRLLYTLLKSESL